MSNILNKIENVVMKVGTAGITSNGSINYQTIDHLARTAYNLLHLGKKVTIVTSGAIASGRRETSWLLEPEKETLGQKQALAAIGQAPLMHAYYEAFRKQGLIPAQLLLSRADFEVQKRLQALKATYDSLRRINHTVPIINENDPIATEEIKFTDNDHLQELVTTRLGGDVAINLITFPGLIRKGEIVEIGDSYSAQDYDDLSKDIREGRGGLQGKLNAMKAITSAGKTGIIGHVHGNIIGMILGNYQHTRFLPQ